MKYTKLYIRFFAVEVKTNSNGQCPIYCKISHSKKAKQFSTGIFIKPVDWNKEAQMIKSSDANHITKNGLVQTITSKLLKIELELHLDDEFISLDIFTTGTTNSLRTSLTVSVNTITCTYKK